MAKVLSMVLGEYKAVCIYCHDFVYSAFLYDSELYIINSITKGGLSLNTHHVLNSCDLSFCFLLCKVAIMRFIIWVQRIKHHYNGNFV